MEILPSEGYLTENKTTDGSKEIEEQVSDFLSKIGNKYISWNTRVMMTDLWQSG